MLTLFVLAAPRQAAPRQATLAALESDLDMLEREMLKTEQRDPVAEVAEKTQEVQEALALKTYIRADGTTAPITAVATAARRIYIKPYLPEPWPRPRVATAAWSLRTRTNCPRRRFGRSHCRRQDQPPADEI